MYPETKPIVFNTPPDMEYMELYPFHDMHYGNECCDIHKWNVLRDEVLADEHRFCVFIGDLMENALPGSKSDPLTQRYSPHEQREFVVEQFKALKDRIIAVSDGNHEHARSTKFAGLYPLYDACCLAGIEDKYRSAYAVVDIGVGIGCARRPDMQYRYTGFCIHKAKELKSFSSADMLEGFDFFLYGHDHDPKEHSRAKICYNRVRHSVSIRPIEVVNCGSFLTYGGYGARAGYRPQSSKQYKLILYGTQNKINTLGFYVN